MGDNGNGNGNKKIGAVMVVGGGIGGTQASLDLATCGYKVYLVEKTSAIGGVMAQLDKTFPTNDCAMCTLAPRLVEAGGHLDIVKMTNSEVEEVKGSAGNFEVRVKQKARFIDLSKCTGCGVCAEKCPVHVNGEFDGDLVKRTAIYRRYPQAVPGAYAIDKQGVAPCRFGCPAGVNCHAYVALIAQGRFAEAIEVERRENPLPAICGRICPHGCEIECTRSKQGEPLAIAALKRFLADWEVAHPEAKAPIPKIDRREEKIAIVGSGPAGLTAARELALRGYQVTVFESLPEAGGMLRYGIPEYRLPKKTLQHEIQTAVLDLGVELKTNVTIGKHVTLDSLRQQGYKAILLAIGAHEGLKLDIPGENEVKEGLIDAARFLRDLNLGKETRLKGRVAVIGGGNVAMDAARTSLRLGADEVVVVYRRAREQMPANPWEVEEAEEEGIKFRYLAAPVKLIHENGKLKAVECIEMKLGAPDASGRRRPIPVEGSEFKIEADLVIPAISQKPDVSPLPAQFKEAISKWGYFEVDSVSLQTVMPQIFAAGDAVSGPSTAIEAVEAGKRAALSIHRYLNNEDPRAGRAEPNWKKVEKDIEDLPRERRLHMRKLPVEQRKGNFKEVELGYSEEEAVAEAKRCLNCSTCCECLLCVKACEAKAIEHEVKIESEQTVNVGAVVLAPGFELFDAGLAPEFGFGRYPNVVSSLQFERILSAGGPYEGKVLRPSDRKTPKRLALIQCIGSREFGENNYCSSVCCMYATKQAIMAKEHEKDLDCTIFFIDMRAFGKGFDDYYERAKKQGVRYVRCRPSCIREDHTTHNLKLVYQSEKNELVTEEFDMISLSCGLHPPKEAAKLAGKFGVRLNEDGFCYTERFTPVETSVPGVYVCGPFTEPKDIPETVMQACGAASKAMTLLKDERGKLITVKQYPPEKNVAGQEPRIGVFICHCGKNIGGVANVPSIVEYARTLPNVTYAEDNLYTCSADTQVRIQQMLKEHNLNRVVVASCTPRTHERLFRDTCRMGGLNEYLFEMANIRDHNTWVHMHEHDLATEKAKDLVRMAVAKSRMLEPLYRKKMSVNQDALVMGGGLAGMTAALELAGQGFQVHLVEKTDRLGGNMNHISYLLDGEDPQARLQKLIQQVQGNPGIRLHMSSNVKSVDGSYGNFVSRIARQSAEVEVKHGAIVVATGAQERKPSEYLYGQNPRVMTQRELEEKLAKKELSARSVVMIQCVGSREPERPWCSRICCSVAIKNALKIKEISPATEVYVLYRDIRTYGFREKYYGMARDKGVRFLRFDVEKKPAVEARGDKLSVTVHELMMNRDVRLDADLVVLSAGIIPNADTEDLGKMMKISMSQEKFFLEVHMKLRPVDFATDGVFVCGLAHWPKALDESIIQAAAAASRAATILSQKEIELDAAISKVIDASCDGCAYCVDPCPYKAITLMEYMQDGALRKTVEVNESVCKGCGVCQATCPKKGIAVQHFKLEQIEAMVDAALQRV